MSRIFIVPYIALTFLITMSAPSQEVSAGPVPFEASPNDYSRFFAARPLRPESPLKKFTALPGAAAHFERTRELAGKWESRRLSQTRTWARTEIQPKISRPAVLKYMFGGPDFLHAVTLFPEVPEYILAGLEPLGSIPDFSRMTPREIDDFLSHLHHTLRSISIRNFFITKEMKENFSNIRNYLVGDCQYVLQDASGIPADFLALYYDLTYYGNYTGPIDMFSEFDQPGLRQIYQARKAKPLPFGTGYRMRDEDSVQMFGVRK